MTVVRRLIYVPTRFMKEVEEFCTVQNVKTTILEVKERDEYRVNATGNNIDIANLESLVKNLQEQYHEYISNINLYE